MSGEPDGLEGGVVDRVSRGGRVRKGGKRGEDEGEVVLSSRDGKRRVGKGGMQSDLEDGRLVMDCNTIIRESLAKSD